MDSRSVFVVMVLAGCGGESVIQAPDNRILVLGSDMGVLFQNVNLTRGNVPLTGALVVVNETVIPEIQSGHFSGQLPAVLAAGATIRIKVIDGADTVIGTTTVPAAPTLQSPASGTTIHIPIPLDFAWTDSGNPDEFVAGIQYSGTSEVASFGPTARSGIVVTSRIPASATNLSAYLFAYSDGTFTGPVNPASRMHVRQSGGTATLSLGQ